MRAATRTQPGATRQGRGPSAYARAAGGFLLGRGLRDRHHICSSFRDRGCRTIGHFGPASARTADYVQALAHLLPQHSSATSFFFVIGLYWAGHHRAFGLAATCDSRLVWPNLTMLCMIAFMPFATAFLSDNLGGLVPAVFYNAVLLILSLLNMRLIRVATAPPVVVRRGVGDGDRRGAGARLRRVQRRGARLRADAVHPPAFAQVPLITIVLWQRLYFHRARKRLGVSLIPPCACSETNEGWWSSGLSFHFRRFESRSDELERTRVSTSHLDTNGEVVPMSRSNRTGGLDPPQARSGRGTESRLCSGPRPEGGGCDWPPPPLRSESAPPRLKRAWGGLVGQFASWARMAPAGKVSEWTLT